MINAGEPCDLFGANNAAGRAGKRQMDGRIGCRAEAHLAAIGFDDRNLFAKASFRQLVFNMANMVAYERADIGVGDGGRCALILLPLR